MDTEEEKGERVEESPLRRAIDSYIRSVSMWIIAAFLFMGAAIVVDEAVGMNGASAVIIIPTLVISVLAALVSIFVFPASVWEEHVEGKREARRRELEEAVSRLGAVAPQEVSLTPREKLRRVLYDSRKTLLAAAVLEVLITLPFVRYPEVLNGDGGGYDTFMVASMIAMLTPLPLYISFSLLVDMFSEDTSSAADERAERAYREAVKDKEQLAGGLVLDEHAIRAGGELTVQEQAGGLAIHEEVVLDLDAHTEAEAASVHEQASQVETA